MNPRLSREEIDALLWALERALVDVRAAGWSESVAWRQKDVVLGREAQA